MTDTTSHEVTRSRARRVMDMTDPSSARVLVRRVFQTIDRRDLDELPDAIAGLRRHVNRLWHLIADYYAVEQTHGALAYAEASLSDARVALNTLERLLLRGGWPDRLSPNFCAAAPRLLSQVSEAFVRANAYLVEAMALHYWRDLK